jgi:hypothetical protein
MTLGIPMSFYENEQLRRTFLEIASTARTIYDSCGCMATPTTEFSRSVEERIQAPHLERHEITELQGDIGLLSPTAHIISRTRKVQALPNRPLRNAGWISVRLSDEERAIYNRVEELCRMAWGQRADSWGFQMSLLMAYRITASCIPAAMAYFDEKLSLEPRRRETAIRVCFRHRAALWKLDSAVYRHRAGIEYWNAA